MSQSIKVSLPLLYMSTSPPVHQSSPSATHTHARTHVTLHHHLQERIRELNLKARQFADTFIAIQTGNGHAGHALSRNSAIHDPKSLQVSYYCVCLFSYDLVIHIVFFVVVFLVFFVISRFVIILLALFFILF